MIPFEEVTLRGRPRQRVLVVAPHPDDECLGVAGLMWTAVAAGHDVHVVFLTSGDGFVQEAQRYYLSLAVSPEEYLHLGYERQKEAVAALGSLGIPRRHIHFLGFPDGGLDALYRTHWETAWESPTTRVLRVPYLNASGGALEYRGHILHDAVQRLMTLIAPTLLVMPHPLDGHPDHWATHSFGSLALLACRAAGLAWARHTERLNYLIHWATWPKPIGLHTYLEQTPPPSLIGGGRRWRRLNLSPEAIDAKLGTLTAYSSQMELIKPYMLAFVRASEVFAWDPVRQVQAGKASDPRHPDWGWEPGIIPVFQNPHDEFMRRVTGNGNAIEQLDLRRDREHGYLRLSWAPRRADWDVVVRMHVAGGYAPWTWQVNLKSGDVRGEAGAEVRIVLDRETRQVAASWPLAAWQGGRLTMVGAEAVDEDRVIGRTGYLACQWGGEPTRETLTGSHVRGKPASP